MPLNLIQKAIDEAKLYRQQFESQDFGILNGLTPEARRNNFYLRVRESINRGCRESVKLLSVPRKRTIAYSILMQALYTAFHHKLTPELLAHYNAQLDKLIGEH